MMMNPDHSVNAAFPAFQQFALWHLDPRDHASGVVNLALATRNAWSRVKRLAGKARYSSQSIAPAAQGGRRRRP